MSQTIKTQVDDVVMGFWRNQKAAAALVEQFGGDKASLECAAHGYPVRWLEGRTPFQWLVKDGDELIAVRRLVVALVGEDASPRFRALIEAVTEKELLGATALSTLLLLAGLRTDPDNWRDRLVAAALAESSAETVSGIAQALPPHEAKLAYEILEALAVSKTAGAESARQHVIALAVSRIGTATSFVSEARHLAQLDRGLLLNAEGPVHRAARLVLRSKPAARDVLLKHLGSLDDLEAKEFVLALHLLAAAGERDHVAKSLCERIGEPQTQASSLRRSEMFMVSLGLFVGWGEHSGPSLVAKAMLERRDWDENFWRFAFSETFTGFNAPDVTRDNALRKCLSEAFLLIADDAAIPIEDRRLAIEALGRLGRGRIGGRLGRVRHLELAPTIRAAQTALRKTGKGHPVAPHIGIRLALDTFRADGYHWRR